MIQVIQILAAAGTRVFRYLNCCSQSFDERVRNGFTHAFCTIIILCYVDITHIALQLLHPASVGERTVLFADGNMEFFGDKHKIYGSIAGVLVVFVICFPIILIIYPAGKNQHIETLRACYKTRRHFFVAYYLGCRVLLLVISTYVPAGPLKSALLQLCCILILFIIAAVRPYKEANEAGEAPPLAAYGGNEAGEAQRVANQGGNEAQEAGEETVENKWINKSDTVILTTLSAIVALSSPIGSDVSDSTRSGLVLAVRTLAWVPLVMAILPYFLRCLSQCCRVPVDLVMEFLPYALRYLSQCCKARDNHNEPDPNVNERAPLLDGAQQRGVPNEPDSIVNDPTPPLGGAQQRGVPNEPDPNVNERVPLLDGAQQRCVPNEPDRPIVIVPVPNEPDSIVNDPTPPLGGAQQRGVPNEPDPNVNERRCVPNEPDRPIVIVPVPNEPDPIVNEPATPPLGGAQQRGVPSEPDPNVNERAPLLDGAQQRGVPNEPDPIVNEPTLPLGGAQQRGVPNESDPQKNADEFDTTVADELFDTAADECLLQLPNHRMYPTDQMEIWSGGEPAYTEAAWNKTIYVSPSGNDSQGCGHWAKPCKSLDTAFTIAFNGGGSANSTLISAAKGNYTLAKSFNITNVDTFALVGQGTRSDEVRITCEPDVSLSFILCQKIALEGFTLLRCGGWRESTVGINKSAHAGQTHQGVKFKTALDFRYCRNTRFTNIEISSSPGLGVNFFDVGGVVNFTDCVLADNKAANKSLNGSLEGLIQMIQLIQLLNPAIFRKSTVLFADGDMEFFVNTKHIVYGCIAGALMVFVICFPIVLIFYPARKNQHLETLRACYKTLRHFFVAYYLGCRVLLLVISTYVPAGPLKSALLQLCCILILFIIAAVRPYKEGNEVGEAQRVATHGGNEACETQGVANQGGDEAEAQRVATHGGNEADEAQGVAIQGGDEAEAQRVSTHGGNEAGEAQGLANQGGDEAEAQRVSTHGGNEAGEAQGVAIKWK
ncbi:hypothetical protein OS493_011504 [Desmophyllum pertusum]|uniref:Uncharacterized protein n=1 Tax=Desmophyllum pertusum TaxID=174260 RepID=A0A9W9YQR1_9CNID|nr:hypothetical protein OS493_011504 [Desmophyllum pertusum]